MSITLGTREVCTHFSELLDRVGYGGEVVVIKRSGIPLVAMVPMEMYKRFLAEREKAFAVVDQIHKRNLLVSEEEVSDDVNEAIAFFKGDQVVGGN
jgi:prevent-host-death family protein